jgi:hypothetical protein
MPAHAAATAKRRRRKTNPQHDAKDADFLHHKTPSAFRLLALTEAAESHHEDRYHSFPPNDVTSRKQRGRGRKHSGRRATIAMPPGNDCPEPLMQIVPRDLGDDLHPRD